ncbi:hypothetical protein G7K_1504-t1 [Saitoella complicata NRRL Y-17804]|uniref:Uncharacterized protein n=1 Tax=Saitoella complicata (strain BCRC 22490 / CBS 7301 / JCM 7358 / NBRC 10748 / NRRL Y-17804) TaxID=698492 RepID=A0A0E9ND07_SAICN|nr:hypothetical protein G7K_1504-t1 [Saitoella complicata NRRL Y-17804]
MRAQTARIEDVKLDQSLAFPEVEGKGRQSPRRATAPVVLAGGVEEPDQRAQAEEPGPRLADLALFRYICSSKRGRCSTGACCWRSCRR